MYFKIEKVIFNILNEASASPAIFHHANISTSLRSSLCSQLREKDKDVRETRSEKGNSSQIGYSFLF